ncbi:MAG: Stk1 family PASTA domain-containing Ser/Thr kinase [Clostridia bacterium]|nr:Stk1 family PASTA domain-containing Ser/Thr kinase [Clostridia bacterium]
MNHYLGKVLDGRYEIIEIIGTGGMAVVYKARDRKLNRLVAVKVLKPELRSDTELRRRFHAESEAVARLNHPNVINVFDVSMNDENDYFVMELIDGITLKQYMTQRGIMSIKEVLHFVIQTLRGLEHAHAKKIVHRDIKPQNIMILRDGTVKVTDFGIARVTGAQEMTTNQVNAFGSVHYIAPEQARCEATDGRADLYSVGVMLYEMLTGELPYQGDTAVAVAMQHIRSTPVPLHEVNPDVPEALEAITLHAMSASLDTRYASASELIDDLEAYRRDPAGFMPTFAVPSTDGDTMRFVPIPQTERPAPKPQPVRKKQEPVKPAAERKRINVMPIVAAVLLLLVLAAVVAGLWLMILSPDSNGDDVAIPQLVGRTYQAVAEDKSLDFELVIVGRRHHPTYDEGVIIEQNQLVGNIVKEGSRIELIVSLGKRVESMPNYINWDYAEANKDLRTLMEKTVTVQYSYEASETVARNNIIRTIPISGQPITEGDVVTFVISQGTHTDTVPMPQLIGLTEDQARSLLSQYGLTIGIVDYEETDVHEPGRVLEQSTPPTVEVPVGMTVNITLSKPVATEPPATEPPETTTEPPETTTEPTTEATSTEPPTEPPTESTTEPTTELPTLPPETTTEPPVTPEQTEPSTSDSETSDTTTPEVTLIPSVSQSTAPSEPPATPEETTKAGFVDWTLILPQGVEFPEQYLLEIYADGTPIYTGTVSKTDGSLTLRIHGDGNVKIEAYIDTSLYKTETITIS